MNDTRQCVIRRGKKPCGRRCDGEVCPGCQTHIDQQLAELPDLYARLFDELEPGTVVPDGTRPTKADAPLPVRLEVLNLRQRGGMVAILEEWETAWREDFELTAGTFRGDTEQTLVGVIEFLRVWLDKACAVFPGMAAFAGEVRDLHATCRALLGEIESTFSPGACPVILDDATECHGRLTVDRWGANNVSCPECHTEWTPEKWLLLGGEIDDPRQREATG